MEPLIITRCDLFLFVFDNYYYVNKKRTALLDDPCRLRKSYRPWLWQLFAGSWIVGVLPGMVFSEYRRLVHLPGLGIMFKKIIDSSQ